MLVRSAKEAGENLAFVRKRLGLTQAQTAELAGMAERTYADIERGESNMRLDSLLQICSALKVEPNDFLTVPDPADEYDVEELLRKMHSLPVREQNVASKVVAQLLESLKL